MQPSIQFEKFVDLDFDLAECPRWDWRTHSWMWVNICDGELWRNKDGQNEKLEFEEPIGCFALHGEQGFTVALKSGMYLVEAWGSEKKSLAPLVSEFPRMRYNDGRGAPGGRFVAGTRNGAKVGDQGQFHQLNLDGTIEALPMFAWTCNGLAFSPDGQWLYWADTGSSKVYKHSYNPETGEYGEQVLHCDLDGYEGRPDGASVDVNGNYWVAMYAGQSVVQISPEGEVKQVVSVPSENPTMVGFGGETMKDLMVTSAASDNEKGKLLIAKDVVEGVKESLVTVLV
ncbi:Smp-30/Cgr1 family protein [Vibrio sp. 10N.286.49.C2]|uniref:SMP-30/gluconolactonase/LRE family protein n=1 Tax=unclassified Vibrio TaxID=2614977 RepID=UPI000C8230B3|nr:MULTISPECIES: SMP-30/gluconolactonase/LRE family protein [unclassified Vibrio]PMH30314.1 Smp-30/Cgr1 family protein [Vibrio sp. 10N.286.49.C2]PMH50865.1 Smp-30/Cgr1 family protein [Vibrio sp. 10N.286.49.B1]PMH80564.1 Smp-30/Cgr1 family protein [Vibrio sp. 10N.286.48.B7]